MWGSQLGYYFDRKLMICLLQSLLLLDRSPFEAA